MTSMSFRAVTLRLRPNKHQQKVLEETRLICMRLWNHLKDECIATYMETGRVMSVYDLNALIPPLKKEQPELLTVHSHTLQNVSRRVHDAVVGSLKRKGEKAFRFPRSKDEKRYRCYEYVSPKDFRIEGDMLSLGKMNDVGGIRFRCSQRITEGIRRCQIVKRKSHWYARILIEVEGEGTEWLEDYRIEVGMDLGLARLATMSDGTVFENIRFDKAMSEDIARIQRKMSEVEIGSSGWWKLKNRLENRFGRISDLRSNYLCHVAKSMVESYRFIAMEDIDIKKLVQKEWRSTRRSQYNASWGILEDRLTRAAERSGTTVVEVDPRGTSQMCSGCGRIVAKDLSVRVHDCPHCGLVMDRDLNASRNILAAGRAASASSREPRGSQPDPSPDRRHQLGCHLAPKRSQNMHESPGNRPDPA